MKRSCVAGGLLALVCSAANAGTVLTYTSGFHNEAWQTAGSNGASNNVVYGDGANNLVSPQSKCVNSLGTLLCSDKSGIFLPASGGGPAYTFPSPTIAGDNGTYWSGVGGATPSAIYGGTLIYDETTTFTYTDAITSVTESWHPIVTGSLTWTGAYGLEVVVAPGASGTTLGGSFFSFSFANGAVNLRSGIRTGTSKCDLGIAGASTVGSLLCGFANPATAFQYRTTGAYMQPNDWSGIRDNGNGTYDLLMYGTRFTSIGAGNNLQERLQLAGTAQVVPVPAAFWLFGGALGALGALKRKAAA